MLNNEFTNKCPDIIKHALLHLFPTISLIRLSIISQDCYGISLFDFLGILYILQNIRKLQMHQASTRMSKYPYLLKILPSLFQKTVVCHTVHTIVMCTGTIVLVV